jgi:radical SAM protein
VDPHAARDRQVNDHKMLFSDFSRAPFTIAWEVTRACPYACSHCRADAQPFPHPNELTNREAHELIDRMALFGNNPILVFTGGDPLMRCDLFDLIRYATSRGLRCSLTPTATALADRQKLIQAKEAGIHRLALSLDAPRAEVHDAFRGVGGSWSRTVDILRLSRAVGLPFQINTTVARHNFKLLSNMAPFVQELGAVQWSLFFLVPTGRAQAEEMLSAEEHEQVFHWLYDLSRTSGFDIKATAAPMYRRVAIERARAEGRQDSGLIQGAGFRFEDGLNRPARGANDGNGFLFVSHVGEIMPSGFLPIPAGNVRDRDLVEVYREDPLFRALRDPDLFHGPCGKCAYRSVCGGQRGRAYALTGDYLASDPACILAM